MKMKKILFLSILFLFKTSYAQNSEIKFEQCRAKLIKAQKLDLLRDLDWKKGSTPKVVVGPTFFSVDFTTKEGFAETVSCFLVVGEDKCMNYKLTHWMTGKVVANFQNCKFQMN
jgi:hypothetical protein